MERNRYVQVHPLTYLAKLHIEMNMAELLGKVVKRSTERRSSVPEAIRTQSSRRAELGSAKDIIMPPHRGNRSHRSRGGGQIHGLNMDILNSIGEERGSSSGTQGDVEIGCATEPQMSDAPRGRPRVDSGFEG